MGPDRFIRALTTVQIIISLVLFIIVLPFFILWRISISLLYFTKKEPQEPKNVAQERKKEETKEEEKDNEEENSVEEEQVEEERKPDPHKDTYERALAPYTKLWKSFKTLPLNKPLVTNWSHIACTALLLTQTVLSLALLEKSLVYHIPWFVTHLSDTHYKTTKKKIWWNDLLLHVVGLVITCAPFLGLVGVGTGIVYYAVKVWKYGRFKRGMERRRGGRGYEESKGKKEGGDGGKSGDGHGHGHGVRDVVDQRQGQPDASPYAYAPGYSEDILFEQPAGGPYGYHDVIQPPPAVMVQSPARFDKNPYTLAGIASIWSGNKEKLKTGYDGRDTRRRNFADDIEMADRVGRR